MNTDIEFLRTLEEDLEAAAARQAEREGAGGGSGPIAPFRTSRPIRDRHWPQIAAAIVALLVIAGGIGFIAQHRLSPSTNGAAVAGGSPAPDSRTQLPAIQHGTRDLVIPAPSPQAGSSITGSSLDKISNSQGSTAETVGGADLSKIARTGSVTLQVPDGAFAKTAVPAVYKVAAEAGGFVLSSNTKDQKSGTFTLRVPSKRFDSAMAALSRLGTVQASDSSAKDVTAQWVDYKARLRILYGRRAVVFSLLSKATTISQTLELESEFDKVELQIEQYKGQLNVLRNQVAESTIVVDVAEKDTPKPPSTSDVRTPSLFKSLRLGWQGFVRVIGSVIVGLGYLIPLGAIALAIWALALRTRRRREEASTS